MADFDIVLALSLEGHTWPERAMSRDPKSNIMPGRSPLANVDAPTGTVVLSVQDQKARPLRCNCTRPDTEPEFYSHGALHFGANTRLD